MIYCEPCRKSNGWRTTPKVRDTYCDKCQKRKLCYENPSWNMDMKKYPAKHSRS